MLIAAAEEASALGIAWGIGGFFICFYVIMAAIFITLFVFWIISIIDIAQRRNNEFPNSGENETPKTTWLLLLLVTLIIPLVAGIMAVIYYFSIMKKMPRGKKQDLPPDLPKNE